MCVYVYVYVCVCERVQQLTQAQSTLILHNVAWSLPNATCSATALTEKFPLGMNSQYYCQLNLFDTFMLKYSSGKDPRLQWFLVNKGRMEGADKL